LINNGTFFLLFKKLFNLIKKIFLPLINNLSHFDIGI